MPKYFHVMKRNKASNDLINNLQSQVQSNCALRSLMSKSNNTHNMCHIKYRGVFITSSSIDPRRNIMTVVIYIREIVTDFFLKPMIGSINFQYCVPIWFPIITNCIVNVIPIMKHEFISVGAPQDLLSIINFSICLPFK